MKFENVINNVNQNVIIHSVNETLEIVVIQLIDVHLNVQIHELETINVIINATIKSVIMMVVIVMISIVLLDVHNGELEIIFVT